MLSQLYIENYILIDRLSLDLRHGLTTLTGETGVGKSIILGALALAFGARGDSKSIRQGTDNIKIIATIENFNDNIIAMCQELGINHDDHYLILRRHIYHDGKSRCFINDNPVPLQTLKKIGNHCADIQGQFDNRGLLDIAVHRQMLDNYAQNEGILNEYRHEYYRWQKAEQTYQDAIDNAEKTKQQYGFLNHIVKELSQLHVKDGEYEELREKRHAIKHHVKHHELLKNLQQYLDGESGARIAIQKMNKLRHHADELQIGNYQQLYDALDIINQQFDIIDDYLMTHLNQHITEIPEDIDKRFFTLQDCAKKYQLDPNVLETALNDYKTSLNMINDDDKTLENLANDAKKYQENAKKLVKKLHISRQEAATILENNIMSELSFLHMEKCIFHIEIIYDDTDMTASGADKVTFMAATNSNMKKSPLHKTASGGELSRMLLALSIALGNAANTDCLVFDEIDQGVGGATAAAIGSRLHFLSRHCQIIMITHSPQIAAAADQHIKLEKHFIDNTTTTHINILDSDKKREEIARMLAGANISDAARAAADELIASYHQ